jgi:hypothetical protein
VPLGAEEAPPGCEGREVLTVARPGPSGAGACPRKPSGEREAGRGSEVWGVSLGGRKTRRATAFVPRFAGGGANGFAGGAKLRGR